MKFYEIKFAFNHEQIDEKQLDMIFNRIVNLLDLRFDDNLISYRQKNDENAYELKEVSDEAFENEMSTFFKFTFKDIINVPLYKFLVLKRHNGLTILANIHSSIFDYSAINVIKELFNNPYEVNIPKTTSPYFEEYEEYLNSQDFENDCSYWNNKLLDAEDYVKYFNIKSNNYRSIGFSIENESLLTFLKNHKISRYNFFTAIFSLYLSRADSTEGCLLKSSINTDEVVFGPHTKNTLLMIDYYKNDTFEEYLNRIQENYEEAINHTKVRIEDYVDNSFYYAIHDFTNLNDIDVKNGDGSALTFNIYNDSIDIIYNYEIFSDIYIRYMIENIKHLIDNVLEGINQHCGDLEVLSIGNQYDFNGLYELTDSQRIVYSDAQNAPGTRYNNPLKIGLGNLYSVTKIKKAINRLLKLHPILTSRIIEEGYLLGFDAKPPILRGSVEDIETFVRPFELNRYLSRFLIVEDKNKVFLCMDFHSLIFDANSFNTIINSLLKILNDENTELVDTGILRQISFEEVVNNSEYRDHAQKFYNNILSERDDINDLVFSVAEDSSKSYVERFSIDEENLTLFLDNHNITHEQFFTSVFAYTLSRFTGSPKVLFNLITDGRAHLGLSDSVGMFFQTSPVLMQCDNQSVESFMNYSRDIIDNVSKFDLYSFMELVFDYQLENSVSFGVLQDIFSSTIDMEFEMLKKDMWDNFSVVVYYAKKDILEIRIFYSEKFSDNFVKHFVDSFKLILEGIINEKMLSDINYIDESDLKLLDGYNETERKLMFDDILEAFNFNLFKDPNKPLVSYKDKVYSYSQGAFISDKLATTLKDACVGVGDNVAFLVERSELYMFCVLGVLSTGAAYVPLDDAHPDERIKFILNDTDANVIIVSDGTYNRVKSLNDDAILINISDIVNGEIGELNSLPVVKGDIACILYTSGSTGLPKGVKIKRYAILNSVESSAVKYDITNDDVYGLFATIGFNIASLGICQSFYTGACLSVVPNDVKFNMVKLNDYFIEQGVTITLIITQVGKLYMETIKESPLKLISVGGEKLGEFDNPNDYMFINGFGLTEVFSFITGIYDDKKIDSSSIGFWNFNTKIYILDNEFRRVPIGAVGELCISGYQVSEGYLNREEENTKAFVKNPFNDSKGYEVLFRTGDMVRILPDGTLGIIGRRDTQVKVRGNRVELSEVESVIRQLNHVTNVSVQTVKHESNNELVAYVVVDNDCDEEKLRKNVLEHVYENKPSFMVPSYVIKMDEIPMNVHGKVDKRALPEVSTDNLRAQYVAPTNETERIIVEAFETVLDQDGISLYDDFVRLGGDSIKSIRVISLIQKEGIPCKAKDILTYKTPYMIARNIGEKVEVSYDAVEGSVDLLPIQSYFFDKINRNDFTQEFVFESADNLDLEILQEAWNKLSDVHDMLRATYNVEDGEVVQEILPLNTQVCKLNEFNIYEDLDENISEIIENAKNSLDISNKLSDVSLVHYGEKSYLVFVIHHLIVDDVSWSVLLDDLTYIYTQMVDGNEINLSRPYPYKLWVNDVKKLVEDISEEEKEHWVKINSLLDDSSIKGKAKSFNYTLKNISFDVDNLLGLSEEEYFALSIARAYKKTYGKDIIFNHESYGREESLADVNRTIGWFTTQYPIFVDVGDGYDSISLTADAFKLKRAFKEIKNQGLNYSSLIYNVGELEFKHCPVTLNFLSTEFAYKNELFETFNIQSDSDRLELCDVNHYGVDFNVLHVDDDYVMTAECADGTYIDNRFAEFIENIMYELEFIAGHNFEDGIVCGLSESQLGIYLDEKVHDKGTAYTVPGLVRCDSKFSVDEIKDAILTLIDKHPVLKGRIVDMNEMPLIICDASPEIGLTDSDDYSDLIKLFDLEKSLSRFYIINNDNGKAIFYDVHHIISDATSLGLISKELKDILDGKLSDDVDLGFVYASLDSFESQFRPGYEEAHAFYAKQFADVEEVNNLLEDLEGHHSAVSLPIHGIREDIEKFAHDKGITVGILLNAVFAYTYSRFVGSDKVYFNFTEHGRHEEKIQNALGMFVRTIPLMVDCKNDSIDSYLTKFSDLALNSMINAVYPFRLLASEFNLNNDVIFEYNFDLNDVSHIKDEMVVEEPIVEFVSDFLCVVNDLDDGFVVRIDHSDMYSDGTIVRFVESYREILIQMLEKEELSEIEFISKTDIDLLDGYNQTEHEFEYDDILDRFNSNLGEYEDSLLVGYEDTSYTHGQGAFIINEVAKMLRDNGVEKQDFVGLFVERSEWFLLASMGVLSIGSIYVPIDVTYPDERIQFMLGDTGAGVVIVTDETEQCMANIIVENDLDIEILNVSSILEDNVGSLTSIGTVEYSDDDIACVLYTSGTTGVPKGVLVTREAVNNFVYWYVEETNFTSDDIYGMHCSYVFDIHTAALYAPVAVGGGLYVVPEDIRLDLSALNDYYVKYGCTHTYITSQVGKLFAESGMDTTIKLLCFGGMKLGELDAPDSIGPFETYGPSENLAVSTSIFANERIHHSSIGRFISNVKGYVLDSEQRRLPIGAVGELYLAGAQLTPGYLNREEETEKAFFDNTFDDDEGYERLYCTGDVVRFLPDGTLSIIGRRDSQVKIRGNRVELSEVEDVIRNIEYLEDVTVQTVVHDDNNELVAYVVVNNDLDGDELTEAVRSFVGDCKPEYMMPSFVVRLDEIPLNVNGKVDKRALPDVDRGSLLVEYVAPSTEAEKLIVHAFEEVFNQDKIGVYDDFVRLGGDSLTAIKVLSYLDGYNVTAADILSLRTPFAIAESIKEDTLDLDVYTLEEGCPLNESQLNVYLDIVANDKFDIYLIPTIVDIAKDYEVEEILEALDV
ncbi:AMP-binding protein, partial [Methanobrevibacter sp.]|uniref:AMP-binding protein n=1 Tax=Methanobrevibacter sp. TaxID=66852 RepID=UPI0038906843